MSRFAIHAKDLAGERARIFGRRGGANFRGLRSAGRAPAARIFWGLGAGCGWPMREFSRGRGGGLAARSRILYYLKGRVRKVSGALIMKQFWCVRVARCVREFSGVQGLGVGGSWVNLVLANWCSAGLCAADFVWVSISGFEVWPCVYWAAEFF
jgi:hypothetical protein